MKLRLCIACLSVVLTTSCASPSPKAESKESRDTLQRRDTTASKPLAPTVAKWIPRHTQNVTPRYDYVDTSLTRKLILPDCIDAQPFSEGLAWIRPYQAQRHHDDQPSWKAIDTTGAVIIDENIDEKRDTKYYDVKPFHEGRAAVCVSHPMENPQWGYIDRMGKMVITPMFSHAESFKNGVARVQCSGRVRVASDIPVAEYRSVLWWDEVDTAGILLGVQRFRERNRLGLLNADVPDTMSWNAGQNRMWSTSLRGAHGSNTVQAQCALIDTAGNPVHTFNYAAVRHVGVPHLAAANTGGMYKATFFSHAMPVSYALNGGAWRLIDTADNRLTTSKYLAIGSFSDGRARVVVADSLQLKLKRFKPVSPLRAGLYGFIDTAGNDIIPPVFEDAAPFSEGLAWVKEKGMWGAINPSGVFVIQPQFPQQPALFDLGVSRTAQGYIDRRGVLYVIFHPHSAP